jgi:hypothetical protein
MQGFFVVDGSRSQQPQQKNTQKAATLLFARAYIANCNS